LATVKPKESSEFRITAKNSENNKKNIKTEKTKKIVTSNKHPVTAAPIITNIEAANLQIPQLLTCKIELSTLKGFVIADALVDSGAAGNFIHPDFVKEHQIPLALKSESLHAVTVDGRPLSSGAITHETLPVSLVVNKKSRDDINFDVAHINIGTHRIILGQPCLSRHNPAINWRTLSMTFPEPSKPATRICFVSAQNFERLTKKHSVFSVTMNPAKIPDPVSVPSVDASETPVIAIPSLSCLLFIKLMPTSSRRRMRTYYLTTARMTSRLTYSMVNNQIVDLFTT